LALVQPPNRVWAARGYAGGTFGRFLSDGSPLLQVRQIATFTRVKIDWLTLTPPWLTT